MVVEDGTGDLNGEEKELSSTPQWECKALNLKRRDARIRDGPLNASH